MATQADAELILKLYELRREETMRKARNFVGGEFQPKTFEEFRSVGKAAGTPENAYWRQVLSYWDMVAAIVLRGAVDPDLFFDTTGEGLFLYAKFRAFHAQFEQETGVKFMRQTSMLVDRFPQARAVYERVVKQQEARKAEPKST